MTRGFAPFVAALPALLALSLSACSGPGKYVWVNELPAATVSEDYRIRSGDLVSIVVFQQEAMSVKSRVRTDGKIAFPILGDVEMRGRRPADVKALLEGRLKEYVVTPHVTVSIEESLPVEVSVLGEVAHPGNFTLKPNAGVASALANAGGLTDYADKDRIFVVRPPQRIRFTYKAIAHGEAPSATFLLEAGDVIVVE
jgi:polysaccharide biosynthesis/export protein